MSRTGFVCHELYFWHDPGSSAASRRPDGAVLQADEPADRPEAKRRLLGLLEASGYIDQLHRLTALPATDEQLCRFHTRQYLDRLRATDAAGGGQVGPAGWVGPGSAAIAVLAVGGALVATEAVVHGSVDNAYALVRPAGHHARSDEGVGFCLLNNVVLAAAHARAELGLGRVAIVDWDAHHGNGTQEAFYEERDVLTVSLHQDGRYPAGSGALDENGSGPGEGSNINVPLPPGSGDGAYRAALERVVVPALEAFRPDLVLVASGYDAGAYDSMANMIAHAGTFAAMTASVLEVASVTADGRVVAVHEGGYASAHVPFCGLAVIEQLTGVPSGIDDPFGGLADLPYQGLQPHQASIIEAATALVDRVPR
jgi:acetoin utilization deacetylase AcuC-like enzyme